MKKTLPITLQITVLKDEESERRVQIAYSRIFEIAKKNILERQKNKKLKKN